jgi:hypothetical protein
MTESLPELPSLGDVITERLTDEEIDDLINDLISYRVDDDQEADTE